LSSFFFHFSLCLFIFLFFLFLFLSFIIYPIFYNFFFLYLIVSLKNSAFLLISPNSIFL
jgi:hypothetical protein